MYGRSSRKLHFKEIKNRATFLIFAFYKMGQA